MILEMFSNSDTNNKLSRGQKVRLGPLLLDLVFEVILELDR